MNYKKMLLRLIASVFYLGLVTLLVLCTQLIVFPLMAIEAALVTFIFGFLFLPILMVITPYISQKFYYASGVICSLIVVLMNSHEIVLNCLFLSFTTGILALVLQVSFGGGVLDPFLDYD